MNIRTAGQLVVQSKDHGKTTEMSRYGLYNRAVNGTRKSLDEKPNLPKTLIAFRKCSNTCKWR